MKTLEEINHIGRQAKAGDKQALQVLWEEICNYYAAWAKVNINVSEFKKQLLNDSFQNLYIYVADNIQNWDENKGNVRTFFYQYFQNLYNDTFFQNSGITIHYRKMGTAVNELLTAENVMIDDLVHVENEIDFELLKKRLDKRAKNMFSKVDYQVFILYFFEEKNLVEIGRIIGKTTERIRQIVKKLKERMKI